MSFKNPFNLQATLYHLLLVTCSNEEFHWFFFFHFLEFQHAKWRNDRWGHFLYTFLFLFPVEKYLLRTFSVCVVVWKVNIEMNSGNQIISRNYFLLNIRLETKGVTCWFLISILRSFLFKNQDEVYGINIFSSLSNSLEKLKNSFIFFCFKDSVMIMPLSPTSTMI